MFDLIVYLKSLYDALLTRDLASNDTTKLPILPVDEQGEAAQEKRSSLVGFFCSVLKSSYLFILCDIPSVGKHFRPYSSFS